jgi:thioredoxin 1
MAVRYKRGKCSTGTVRHSFCALNCRRGKIMETFSSIIKSEKPVLVDFFAEWCGPCKMMAPELKRFAESHKEEVRVLKVDIDKNQQSAREFNIQGVPTLVLFKNGKVLWRQSGAMSAAQIYGSIRNYLN